MVNAPRSGRGDSRFESGHPDYSYLNASIGLFREAFRAGYIPKIRPTIAETPTPNRHPEIGKTKVQVKETIRLNKKAPPKLKRVPKIIPPIPPNRVKITDSKRN